MFRLWPLMSLVTFLSPLDAQVINSNICGSAISINGRVPLLWMLSTGGMSILSVAFLRPPSPYASRLFLKSQRSTASHAYVGIPDHIHTRMSRRLDMDKGNPIGLAAQFIRNFFVDPKQKFNSFGSVFTYIPFSSEPISIRDNFDELQVPLDHVSREPRNNFYVSSEYVHSFSSQKSNKHHSLLHGVNDVYTSAVIDRIDSELQHSHHKVLPTHVTSHLPDLLRRGFRRAIYSGQVFRRDAIDSKHYPVFHQLDGFMLFTKHEIELLRSSPSQGYDDIIMCHLKETLEGLVTHLIGCVVENDKVLSSTSMSGSGTSAPCNVVSSRDRATPRANEVDGSSSETVKPSGFSLVANTKGLMSWDSDTTFPFTNPSLELYLKLNDEWIEILGCGNLKNVIITNHFGNANLMADSNLGTDPDDDVIVGGWAFGIGLERLVMTLCGITDIRQFWEEDERFMRQYRDASRHGVLPLFKPYSRNPQVCRDISFYVDEASGGKRMFEESEFIGIIEELCRDYVEDVAQLSTYVHPLTGRKSLCYRVTYRAMGENLTNAFVNQIHQKALDRMVAIFNIELR